MKWLKDLPVDIMMLWLHCKTWFKYIWEDIKEIIKDIFIIPKD